MRTPFRPAQSIIGIVVLVTAAACTGGSRPTPPGPSPSASSTSVSRPFSAWPSDYARLPTLSFVIPNLLNDMHDGSVQRGDSWLHTHLASYATWARSHRSLLIVTWDEDDSTVANHIATIAVGDGVPRSTWTHRADHYTVLAALERAFGLPALGHAADRSEVPPLY